MKFFLTLFSLFTIYYSLFTNSASAQTDCTDNFGVCVDPTVTSCSFGSPRYSPECEAQGGGIYNLLCCNSSPLPDCANQGGTCKTTCNFSTETSYGPSSCYLTPGTYSCCVPNSPPGCGTSHGAQCCPGSPPHCNWPMVCAETINTCVYQYCFLTGGECVDTSECVSGCAIALPPGGFRDCFGGTFCCDRKQMSDPHCVPPSLCLTSSNQPGIKTPIGCLPYADNLSGTNSGRTMISALLGKFVVLSGAIFLLLLVYGSFLYTTSSGDTKKVQAGRELISAGIAGMVLIVLTVTILNFVGLRVLNLGALGFRV